MNANKILRFANIFYSLAAEEELPTNSDDLKTVLGNLEKLETYNARKKYAEANLEHLSSGSSRIVYLTKNKTVVKLAKNDKGLQQNEAEREASAKCHSKFLNKVLNYAKDYSWVEVPFLEKITEKEFEEMTGQKFSDFGDAISYGLRDISGSSDKKEPKNFKEVQKSEIYKEIKDIGHSCKLLPGDLSRISSFGEKDGHPVLLDAGLTLKIWEQFYEENST